MARIKWFVCGAYPCVRYSLVHGANELEYAEKRFGLDASGYIYGCGATFSVAGNVIVYISSEIDDGAALATLVHEAVHVWQSAVDFAGDSKCPEEAEAYGIEEIFRNLLPVLRRARGR